MPFAESHDTRIYYETYGEGEQVLVFAHGMGGNAAVWYQQVAAFADRYRVLVFDHRWFGRSTCAESDFKPAWFVDDIEAVLDAANIAKAIFVCQSMGGWTGSQMAIQRPDRVEALLMSHTPGVFEHPDAMMDREAVTRQVSVPASAFSTPALAADYPDRCPQGAALYGMIAAFNAIDPSVIPRAIGAAKLGVDTRALENYRIPTWFVTADKDALFPSSYIEALAVRVPGARFINLGDAGHSSYFERPEAFNAVLEELCVSVWKH